MKALRKHGYWLLFAAVALATVYMDVYVAHNVLDGDASDFMCRAWTFARERNPFTKAYYATTELRPLDISFVFSLFFLLTDNWTVVRVLGTVVMQAAYTASFLFMTRQAGVKRSARVTAAALLLTPFSTCYARLVLYHLHYILYLGNTFLLVGLTLMVLQRTGRRRVLPACLLGLLWLFVGLNGVRHLMIIGAPMLLFCAIALYRALNQTGWQRGVGLRRQPIWYTDAARLTAIMAAGCLCFAVGYVVNQKVLLPYFGTVNSASVTFTPNHSANQYTDILNGLLLAIGARYSGNPVMGLRGLSLLAALFGFGWMVWRSLRSLWEPLPLERRLMPGLLALSLFTTTLVFVFEDSQRHYVQYYAPVVALAAPLLAWELDRMDGAKLGRRAVSLLCCLCLLFQGAYTLYYLRVEKNRMDVWSGLPVKNLSLADECRDCLDFMRQNGYDYAWMEYWHASVMTELSQGGVTAAPYNLEDGMPRLYQWGVSRAAVQRQNMPDTLLVFIPLEDTQAFEAAVPSAGQVWTGWKFAGYLLSTDLLLLSER